MRGSGGISEAEELSEDVMDSSKSTNKSGVALISCFLGKTGESLVLIHDECHLF